MPRSKWRNWRFASCLFAPAVAMNTVVIGKDLYLLEFGARAVDVGTILLVTSFATPLMDGLVGRMMDAGVLCWRWFPPDLWGRRAPWSLIHICGMAALEFLFFVPPSHSRWVLNLWFTVVWSLGYWTVAATGTSFEAARVEVYLSKEERIQLEIPCKVIAVAGWAIGGMVVFICMQHPTPTGALISGTIGASTVLLSLIGVDVLRDARGSSHGATRAYSAREMIGIVWSPLASRMMVLRLLGGAYEAIISSTALFYFTFVYGLGRADRAYWLSLFAVVCGCTEILTAPLWARIFSKSTSCMLYLSVCLRIVSALAAPALLLADKKVMFFVIYGGVWRFCNAPYSFWRIAAGSWVCDHDGNNNEGLFCGCFLMLTNWGRALTSALITLGLQWVGYKSRQCLEVDDEDLAICEAERIRIQPPELQTYLIMLVTVVAPSVELVIAALTMAFPLRPGSRELAAILERQTENRSVAPSTLGIPGAVEEAQGPSHGAEVPEPHTLDDSAPPGGVATVSTTLAQV